MQAKTIDIKIVIETHRMKFLKNNACAHLRQISKKDLGIRIPDSLMPFLNTGSNQIATPS